MNAYFIYKKGRGYFLPHCVGYTGSVLVAGMFTDNHARIVDYRAKERDDIEIIPILEVREAVVDLKRDGLKQAEQAERMLKRIDSIAAEETPDE